MTTEGTDGVVTPWEVKGTINYAKLVEQFGTEMIDEGLIARMERVTGQPVHPWIRRGIFFSHRSLREFLDAYEAGKPVFLYTGRGPTSESMHIGHLIPFMFTKYLQDAFKCPLVIQIADDEKYYFRCKEYTDFEKIHRLGFENAKEIIACGFDPEKTFIFSNRDYRLAVDAYEVLVSQFKHKVPFKQLKAIFGLDGDANIGMIDWPIYQSVAAFSQSYPHIFDEPAYCLVPYAIDQDPYFRLLRDVAPKMGLLKNASIMCTFIPPLTGPGGKMSSSTGTDATIFLTDDPKTIQEKVRKYAFSAGGATLEEHRRIGGRPDEDISYQYLRYFEFDDAKLLEIHRRFSSGEMSCGEIKDYLAEVLARIIREHQELRTSVTDETLTRFYSRTPMNYRNTYTAPEIPRIDYLFRYLREASIPTRTQEHEVMLTMEKADEIATALDCSLCKNILLVDPKSGKFFLAITRADCNVNMKKLATEVGVKQLKFATEDQLQSVLGVTKGQVSLFALINDTARAVTVLLDTELRGDLGFHPLTNDRTTVISTENMHVFLELLGYKAILSTSFTSRTQEFWDKAAPIYGDSNMTSTEADSEMAVLNQRITSHDLEHLVCVGAADGVRDPAQILKHLQEHAPKKYQAIQRVTVTDYSPQMVEQAKKRLAVFDRNFEYQAGSAHTLQVGSSRESALYMSVYNATFLPQALILYAGNKEVIGQKVTLAAVEYTGTKIRPYAKISFNINDHETHTAQIEAMKDDTRFFAFLFTTETGFISHYFDQDKLSTLLLEKFPGTYVSTYTTRSPRHILYGISRENGPTTCVITMLNNVLGNIPDDIMLDALSNLHSQFF